MKNRYSILRPLTTKEQEFFALQMCHFFAPWNYNKNCELLEIQTIDKSTLPLSFGDFLKYCRIVLKIDAHKYTRHIERIIRKFVNNAYFTYAGYSHKGSPPYNMCYYSQIELTNAQETNLFWLGDIIGEKFLMEKYKPYIVRFEGLYSDNTSGTGSGILINNSTILTCRHNLTDLKEYHCFIGEKELNISDHKYHEKHDIGIVKLNTELKFKTFPYFGTPYVLDNTLTMGYPPLRGMREAPLISQKGEVNAASKDWNNCDCITISSTVRPGNSGGPVVSMGGYIIGIVTQFANSASSVSSDKQGFIDDHSIPFYNAISSTSIKEIISELDNSIPIIFENYT